MINMNTNLRYGYREKLSNKLDIRRDIPELIPLIDRITINMISNDRSLIDSNNNLIKAPSFEFDDIEIEIEYCIIGSIDKISDIILQYFNTIGAFNIKITFEYFVDGYINTEYRYIKSCVDEYINTEYRYIKSCVDEYISSKHIQKEIISQKFNTELDNVLNYF